jgi:hypothetical protein
MDVMEQYVDVSALTGKTLRAVENRGREILFAAATGERYRMWHEQDCCESVSVEDIVGDLDDLIDSPILLAEDVSSESPVTRRDPYGDSETWTFYRFRTQKGTVTIRWYGSSNGYYSESVSFARVA